MRWMTLITPAAFLMPRCSAIHAWETVVFFGYVGDRHSGNPTTIFRSSTVSCTLNAQSVTERK